MSVIGSEILAGASGQAVGEYQIDRSLRFNSADSAYLNRTPSSAGNRKTWTWSGWIKKCGQGSYQKFFFGGSTSDEHGFRFENTDQLTVYRYSGSFTFQVKTTRVFRDPSAFFHLVVAYDSTQATASNRVKIYINGVQEDSFATSNYPAQNSEYGINNTVEQSIGRLSGAPSSEYFNGYLADVQFVDGQALAPTDFAETDSDNNWNPKAYAGTYGTNGFHLDFSDNSSNAALGTDSSGNSNTWTVNYLSNGAIGLPAGYTASGFTGNLSNIETDDTAYIDADSSHIDLDLGASYVVGTVTFKFKSYNDTSSANYRVELYSDSGYSNLLANSATSNASSTILTITHDFGSTSARYLRLSYQGGGRTARVYYLSTTGATSVGRTADTDSLIDTPTNYDADSGNNGGNYATLNPLAKGSNITLSNGNLDASSAGHSTANTTIAVTSGLKVYMEFTRTGGTSAGGIGFTANLAPYSSYPGQQSNLWWVYDNGTNFVYSFDGSFTQYGAKIGTNDCVQLAIDYDAGKAYIGVNNTWFTTSNGTNGNPATGANPTFTFSTSLPLFPLVESAGYTFASNFGQRAFKYTPPTGFKSHCTTNLPDPVIADGSTAFDAKLWTGNGGTQTISGLNFSPDFVWIKNRSGYNHHLLDTVRGANNGQNVLYSNLTNAEGATNSVTAFTSDGFTVGSNSSVNHNSTSIVGWTWDAGTSTVSNTDGSITSSVRANASAGFSIVSFNSGSAGLKTIGHGLNAAPAMIIVKNRDATSNWTVYHSSGTSISQYLLLNTTDAVAGYTNAWGSADPTSSVFGFASQGNQTANEDMIAYCFAPVEGFSAFGSYTGNGSTDGPFVFTGFRVAWLLTKRTDGGSNNWQLIDATRSPSNVADDVLKPDENSAESTHADYSVDFLSNGFKHRTGHVARNGSGNTYIYAAFAEHPLKHARAR